MDFSAALGMTHHRSGKCLEWHLFLSASDWNGTMSVILSLSKDLEYFEIGSHGFLGCARNDTSSQRQVLGMTPFLIGKRLEWHYICHPELVEGS